VPVQPLECVLDDVLGDRDIAEHHRGEPHKFEVAVAEQIPDRLSPVGTVGCLGLARSGIDRLAVIALSTLERRLTRRLRLAGLTLTAANVLSAQQPGAYLTRSAA
jgi:hypothetical protein